MNILPLPVPDDAHLRAAEIERRVVRDQTEMLFRLMPQPSAAGGVFSLIVGVVLWPRIGGPALATWVVLRMLILALRTLDGRDFLACIPQDADALRRRLHQQQDIRWLRMAVAVDVRARLQQHEVGLRLIVGVESQWILHGHFRVIAHLLEMLHETIHATAVQPADG